MTDRSDSEDSSPENARASRHSILATKYQPTTTRATPDAIRDELRKLSPPSSAEARRALFTLAHALAHVQPYHEREVCAVCLQEGAVAALLELLLGTAVPETVPHKRETVRFDVESTEAARQHTAQLVGS